MDTNTANSNQILTVQSHVRLGPTSTDTEKFSKDLFGALTNLDPGETLSTWTPS